MEPGSRLPGSRLNWIEAPSTGQLGGPEHQIGEFLDVRVADQQLLDTDRLGRDIIESQVLGPVGLPQHLGE